MTTVSVPPFIEVLPDGCVRVNPHIYQKKILDSDKRIIAAIAGAQSGKTEIGPVWLYREMLKRGAGDYLAVTSTYPLMNSKMKPVLENYFTKILNIAQWRESKQTFEFIDGSRLILCSATNPEALEAATAKAAWLDEAGQNQFDRQSWEAVNRRVSRYQGRILITTTPYNFGWLKTDVYDRWERGDTDIEVIQFPSIANPAFPVAEWERLKRILPDWKFQMFNEGRFTRPVGLIYDSFNADRHVIADRDLDPTWPRLVGMDFGGRHTAAVWFAYDRQNNTLYLYREYTAGGMSAAEHVRILKDLSADENIVKRCGGAWSEDQWRLEFTLAGWPVEKPPIKDLDIGITKVSAWHKSGRLFVFRSCQKYIDQKLRYAYGIDDNYNPTGKIENKETFHLLDAERYIISSIDEPHMRDVISLQGEVIIPKMMEYK